jgi:epoxyqueuosine reductase
VAPGVVDARRCLAWLVQAPGSFPVEHRAALGDRIYGCDDCQEVCPPNRRALAGAAPDPAAAWVELVELLAATDDELMARHGRWYIPERDPRYLRRNALVALGNTGGPQAIAALRPYLDGDDDLLREHAAWAADQIGARASS